MSVKTYDFARVVVIRGGVPVLGFADGDSINIEFPESYTDQVGAGGAHTRSKVNDPSATVTLRIQQTSPSNAVFEASAALDAASGAAALPLLIKDLSGTEQFFAAQSWVSQRPSKSFASESGAREWTFRCSGVR